MAEKSVNELPRELRLLFTKGTDAALRENFDYAIDLFNQILVREPGLYECRKALRSAQLHRAGGGTSFIKKMWSSASSSPQLAKGQLALRKDPAEAMHIAEQILNSEPSNGPANRLIVEAARALEMPHTIALSLEVLATNAPKDKGLAIEFANALAEIGETPRAEKILSAIYATSPDSEVAQALKNLSARKTLDQEGYAKLAEGTGSYRDILRDKEEAIALEQQNRQVQTEDTAERLIKEYEERLKTDPNNLKTLRNLAELYTQKKQFDRALSYYERIKTSDIGSDSSLDKSIADTTKRKFEYQIEQLDSKAPDYAEQAAKIEKEKRAYQLAECQKRVDRFPTDLQIRFELGQRYFENGKLSEAIAEFQKAQANPHRRIQAMNYLGLCFAQKNMNEVAIRKFEDALKEKLVFDDEKKELIYNLAGVLDKMGKREEAMKQLELIVAEDIGYRDVGARVDAYYSGSGSSGKQA
jgi:tetratricopeptide (TPR) repeat protein